MKESEYELSRARKQRRRHNLLEIYMINRNRVHRRKQRVSANIKGTDERPRISVHRSNLYIYAQAIDDNAKKTVVSFSSLQSRKKSNQKVKKTEEAMEVGKTLAQLLKEKKITHVVFDRNRFAYNGRVKAVAEGLRAGGIIV